MPSPAGRYSERQIRGLIGAYEELRAKVDTSPSGLHALVQLADLNLALEQIPLEYWEVVLLHGLIGIPQAETARILQVSQQAVSKRFRKGIEETHYLMNGGE